VRRKLLSLIAAKSEGEEVECVQAGFVAGRQAGTASVGSAGAGRRPGGVVEGAAAAASMAPRACCSGS